MIPLPPRREVFGHLALGDAFVLNGMVRTLASDGKPLDLFTGSHYLRDVQRMYADVRNVQVWGLPRPEDFHTEGWAECLDGAIRLGYFAEKSKLFNPAKWDSEMYRLAGVDFSMKWSAFDLPRGLLGDPPTKVAGAFLHDDHRRGYVIDLLRSPRSGTTRAIADRSVWEWIPALRSAAEIHVIDSCFLNLADLMWSKGWIAAKRLVYHKYARRSVPPVLRGPWEVLV